MQVLYQMDVTGETDPATLLENVDPEFDPPKVREAAVELASAAWPERANADARVQKLAPEWPTHRQPPVDRAILRLAHHEMMTGRTPVKIAINEAIELAREYGSEHSPAFVNAVLDKLAKEAPAQVETQAAEPESPQQWLNDALADPAPGSRSNQDQPAP